MLKHKKNQEIFSQVKDVELLRELLRRLDDGDVKTEVIFDEKDKSKGDVILVFNNSKEKLSFNLSRLTKDIFEREVWFNDNKDRYKKERAIVEKELTNQVWYKMTEKERKDWMIARKLWTEEEVEKYWW